LTLFTDTFLVGPVSDNDELKVPSCYGGSRGITTALLAPLFVVGFSSQTVFSLELSYAG
jgi:hypothetical protein